MLKKLLLASLIVLAMLFCFVACDDSSSSKKPSFDAKSTPLTLENCGDSTMLVTLTITGYSDDEINMKYSIAGGEQYKISRLGLLHYPVGPGETICFYGDRKENSGSNAKAVSISCSSDCYIYGNIMSLITSTDFASNTSLENHSDAFRALFRDNSHIKNHETKDLVLPATTLSGNCYNEMFYGCTSLTKAPELPATTLVEHCYEGMFSGCTNLAFVTCLAKTTAQDATKSWLSSVVSTGTFTRPADAVFWTPDANGIPLGWAIINAE